MSIPKKTEQRHHPIHSLTPIKAFNELTKNNPQVTPVKQPLQPINKPFDCQHVMKRGFFSLFPGTSAEETPFKSNLPINKAIPPSYTIFKSLQKQDRCLSYGQRSVLPSSWRALYSRS